MLTRTLTALVLAATPQVPTQPCTLAGPPAEAHWSGAIPPASTAEAPLRVVADVPLPGSASRFDQLSCAHVRDEQPPGGRLEALVVEARCAPRQRYVGDHAEGRRTAGRFRRT